MKKIIFNITIVIMVVALFPFATIVLFAQIYRIAITNIITFIPSMFIQNMETPKWAAWYEDIIIEIMEYRGL